MMRLTVGTTEIQLLLTVESRIWGQIRNQGKMMREARERGRGAPNGVQAQRNERPSHAAGARAGGGGGEALQGKETLA